MNGAVNRARVGEDLFYTPELVFMRSRFAGGLGAITGDDGTDEKPDCQKCNPHRSGDDAGNHFF